MRLLLKVVKSSQVTPLGEGVSIDNTVRIKPPPPRELTPEEREAAQREENIRLRIETEVQNIRRTLEADFEKRLIEERTSVEAQRAEIIKKTEQERLFALGEAQKKAEEILEDARIQAEEIKRRAYEEGRAEGFNDGREEAKNTCQKYLEAAAQFLSGVNAKKDAYFVSVENELLDACIEIANKITLAELKTDKDAIFRILKQAARNFRNSDYIKISLSQLDVSEEVVSDMDFIKSVVGHSKDIEIELLKDAEEGTVILDNGSEIIDASVPTQLELLKEILENGKK
jgi:flagellar assembly protein FliH